MSSETGKEGPKDFEDILDGLEKPDVQGEVEAILGGQGVKEEPQVTVEPGLEPATSQRRVVVDDTPEIEPRRKVRNRSEPEKITEASASEELKRIQESNNPGFRAMALKRLAENAFKAKTVPTRLIDEIYALAEASRLEQTTNASRKRMETPDLPEREDKEGWVKWGRERLAGYFDPEAEILFNQRGGPFWAEIENPFGGKSYQDATLIPIPEVKSQLDRERRFVSELKAIFRNWTENHKSLDALANEKNMQVLSNELLGKFLNELDGEDGVQGEGSRKISQAIAYYARMSLLNEGTKSNLELQPGNGDGLNREVMSIFNNSLSPEEIKTIRNEIANRCGGEFYETIGLVIAKMFGVAAKGSSSIKSQIPDADCVGKLIHTQKWNFNVSSADRWLPLEIAHEVDDDGKTVGGFLFRERDEGSKSYEDDLGTSIKLAVDAFGMQTKGKPNERNYYLIQNQDGRYRLVKDLPVGVPDSGKKLGQLLTTGELSRVDWGGSSYKILEGLRGRNAKSLDLYTMLREPQDSKSSFDITALGKKKETINFALAQYGERTKKWVGFLYLNSWLLRHSYSWVTKHITESTETKKFVWDRDTKNSFINAAVVAGLVDEKLAQKLKNHYKVGRLSF